MGPRDLMLAVAGLFNRTGARYFVTGSMGAMAYGEYRSTIDVDIVVDLRYGDAADLRSEFCEPMYYLSAEAMYDAMQRCGMFNIIHRPTSMKADLIIPGDAPFNAMRFARIRTIEFAPGASVCVSSPEDIILSKLQFYKEGGSDKHARDIGGMIKVSGASLDRVYLETWADKLGVRFEWDTVKAKSGW